MKRIFYFLMAVVVVSSCQKEFSETTSVIPEIPMPNIRVESSLLGKIVDAQGNSVADVEVTYAGETQYSSESGLFNISSKNSNRIGAVVTLSKDGYLPSLRRLNPSAGSKQQLTFQLLSDTPIHQYNAEESSTLTLDDGTSLTFPAEAISYADGGKYSGQVNVSMHNIDPTSDDIDQLLPGSLVGVTTDGDRAALKSYGMIGVELTDDAGRALQITQGETVAWSHKIPASLLANAPDEVPIWSLNEETGLWIEESTAKREGNYYKAEVPHFSYWNLDVPEDFVMIEGNAGSNFIKIEVKDADGEVRGQTLTGEDGYYTLFIPKEQQVTLVFFDPCGNILSERPYGPYSEDQIIGDIDLMLETTQITGSLTNCDGTVVQEGYLEVNGGQIIPISDGQINAGISLCDESEISIVAYSQNLRKISEPITQPYIAGDLQLGALSLCQDNENQIPPSSFVIELIGADEQVNTYTYLSPNFSPCRSTVDQNDMNVDTLISYESSYTFEEGTGQNGFTLATLFLDHGANCDSKADDITFGHFSFIISDGEGTGVDVFIEIAEMPEFLIGSITDNIEDGFFVAFETSDFSANEVGTKLDPINSIKVTAYYTL